MPIRILPLRSFRFLALVLACALPGLHAQSGSGGGGGEAITYGPGDTDLGGGTVTLGKSTTDTLILTGNNTYSGGTLIYGGTIEFNSLSNFGSGDITFLASSTLRWALGTTTDVSSRLNVLGLLPINVFDTNGNDITFSTGLSVIDKVSGNNIASVSYEKTGAGTLTLAAVNYLDSRGGLIITAGTVALGIADAFTTNGRAYGSITIASGATFDVASYPVQINSLSGAGAVTLGSGTLTTDGGAFSGVISGTGALVKTTDNLLTLSGPNTYTGSTTVEGGILRFANRDALYQGNPANWTATQLTVNAGATAAFNVGGTGEFTTSDLATLAALGTATGGFQSGSFLGLDTTHADGGTFTYADALADPNAGANSLGLNKLGTGTLILSGPNTYTGGTTISAGTLAIGTSNALPTNTAVTVASDATLDLANFSTAISALAGAGQVTFGSGSLTLGVNDASSTFSGVLVGSGPVTKLGTGTLTLTGANTYTGGTTISAGTLQIGNGGTTGSRVGNITNDATLAFNRSDDSTYAGVISGTGSVVQAGTGTLTLTGDHTYTGGTTVSDGTLQLGDGGTTGALVSDISNDASLAFNRSDALTFSNVISGTGSVTKLGTGTLSLSGLNTYEGGTTVAAGLINFSSLANFGTGNVTLNGGGLQWATGNTTDVSASAQFNRTLGSAGGTFDTNSNDVTLASVLSGSGTLTKSGLGTLTLSGTNTYEGGTLVSGGLLAFSSFDPFGSGTVTLNGGGLQWATGVTTDVSASAQFNRTLGASGATFDTNDNNVTLASALSGSGALTKTGLGTLSLTAANTYTGGTTVAAGTLFVATESNLGSGPIAITTGGVLNSGPNYLSINHDVSIDGPGSALTTTSFFTFANSGTSSLALTDGASLSANAIVFGANPGSIGSGSVTGANSTVSVADTVMIGRFGGTGTLTVTAGTVIFGSDGGTGTLNLDAGGTLAVGGTDGITNGGTANFNLAGGTVKVTGSDLTSSVEATLTNASTLNTNGLNATLSGVLSGSGGLVKNGLGTLTLSGANTYSGDTTISTGTLALGASNALADTSAVSVSSGATLDLAGYSDTIGTLGGAGSVTLGSGALTVGGANTDSTLSGVISGNGSLTKTGSGTLTLTGINTYTGSTTVTGGALEFSNDFSSNNAVAVTGSTSVLSTGGTLQIGQNGSGTLAVTDGATTTASTAYVGNGIGGLASSGDVIVSGTGSALNVSSTLYLGYFGGGNLTIASGGNVSTGNLLFAAAPGYSGTLNLNSGGTLQVGGTNGLRNDGTASFNLAGGTLQVTSSDLTTSVAATLSNASTLNTNGLNATLSGVLSGDGSLTKTGLGDLTLTGANTYTGGTTLSGGSVSVASANALGTGFVTVNAGATLQSSATLSFNRAVKADGAGALLQADTYLEFGSTSAGSLQVLNGASVRSLTSTAFGVWSGSNGSGTIADPNSRLDVDTTLFLGYVGNGTLTVGDGGTLSAREIILGSQSSGTSTLTINTGGTVETGGTNGLSIGDGSGSVLLAGGTLKVIGSDLTTAVGATLTNASTLNTNGLNATLSGVLSGDGAFTKTGLGDLTLTGANTYTGGTTLSAGTLQIGNGGTTGSLVGDITNDTSLTFNRSDASTFAGVISGSGSLTKLGTGTLSLSGANTYTDGTTISGGLINFSSLANFGSGLVALDGGGLQWATDTTTDISARLAALGTAGGTFDTNGNEVTLAAPLSGSGTLTKTGLGTLTLNGTNTYTGGTTVSAGTLALGANNSLAATGALTLNGGTFDLGTYSQTVGAFSHSAGSLLGTGPLTASSFLFSANTPATIAAILAGSGSLTKIGTGTLTLSGTNTYTGGTTLSAGTLQLGDGGTTGSLLGNITNNATLAFNRSDDLTYANVISGTGSVTKAGSNTLTLTTANTYTGGTTISAGTFQIGNGGTTGSLTGNITNDAALTFNRSDAVTFAGAISGSGSLTKLGSDTLTLTGNNTYTGSTSLSSGTLQIGNGGTSGSLVGDITNDASLVFNRSDASTYAGAISGTGTLTKAGTLSLTGTNTYTGGTTVAAGTLEFGSLALGSGPITTGTTATLKWASGNTSDISSRLNPIATGNRLTLNPNGNTIDFASPISGTGELLIAGPGINFAPDTDFSTFSLLSLDSSVIFDVNQSMSVNTFYTGSGSIINLGSNTLTFTSPTAAISALVTGTGSLVFAPTGPSSLIYLSNQNNSFTGGVTLMENV